MHYKESKRRLELRRICRSKHAFGDLNMQSAKLHKAKRINLFSGSNYQHNLAGQKSTSMTPSI